MNNFFAKTFSCATIIGIPLLVCIKSTLLGNTSIYAEMPGMWQIGIFCLLLIGGYCMFIVMAEMRFLSKSNYAEEIGWVRDVMSMSLFATAILTALWSTYVWHINGELVSLFHETWHWVIFFLMPLGFGLAVGKFSEQTE